MISMSDPKVSQFGHPAPAWVMSYADLMTEMVCFFVVLYALSASLNKAVQQARQDVQTTMTTQHISGNVKVDKDGMRITIEERGEKAFFKSGSAEPTAQLIDILTRIAPSFVDLAKQGHGVLVEGHTDDIPIHTDEFSSNWELSTARSTSVVQYMIAHFGFPAKNMGAVGYGQFKPLYPNDSDEHRASNRRVVFFIQNASDGEKLKGDGTIGGPGTEGLSNPPPPPGTEGQPSADGSPPAPTEPTTDSALPLPQEAPAEQPGQQQ